jgi:LCP family protein required for cell wall assembly
MIMVARIDPTLGRVDVMSIMRDTWVPVAGFGQAKINAALSYGGVKLAVQTVETLLDARIDHVSVIDLRGLEKLTDALGGITVDNPQAFGSNAGGGIRFDEGPISLTGKEVVVFVRDRYSFEDGDFTRVANQRLVLRGLIMKAFSKEVISSPPRLISAYSSIAPFLATDSGINAGLMLSQAGFFVNFDRENINLFTMPNAGIGRSKDGQSIILVDTEKLQKLKSDWQAGNLDGY